MNTEQKTTLLAKVGSASEDWKNAFNQGNSAGCANQYTANATMHARPFGTFNGTEAIKQFWQNLIDEGFAEVEYVNPAFNVIDEKSVIVESHWKMNKASGVIHKELWVMQEDGNFKLEEDDFEVLESDG
ncbi:nuclear transport factor 2 family protein [Aliikangiella coralliicola]|uniref:Nuclear transport factor 2 family protein n=1 Tax=Aliikangiella coralliicola TaxID=2592383 RepID=A0A545UJ67_9GAMM|nr:nuclear transport factor 2 family protein [Aliikangiella coralliicola]TQV89512.1 nuclear transport factor 2 family protein [Aliikangiella coralliicola]